MQLCVYTKMVSSYTLYVCFVQCKFYLSKGVKNLKVDTLVDVLNFPSVWEGTGIGGRQGGVLNFSG